MKTETPKKKRKSKYKSRAVRLNDAIEKMRVVASKITSTIDELQDHIPKDEDDQYEEDSTEYKTLLGKVDDIINELDYSEIETLKQELSDWKDNIEEKFSQTQKFSDLEECVDTFENAISAFETANRNISDIVDGCDVAQEIDDACDDLENVTIPTMFG